MVGFTASTFDARPVLCGIWIVAPDPSGQSRTNRASDLVHNARHKSKMSYKQLGCQKSVTENQNLQRFES